jgi:CRP/FNR family transcriptional regulator, cyclic AMP receptor protein
MMTMPRASPMPPTSTWPPEATWTPQPGAEPETCLARFGVSGTVVRLEVGDPVFSQGGPADAVFYVRDGQVKLTVVSNTGKEAVLGVVRNGEFVGMSCLAAVRVRASTATAMADCELLRIDRDVMMRALHRNDALAEMFVAQLLARNIRAEADLVDQLLNGSEKRLARVLLLLAHVGGDTEPATVTLKLSQETLAEMVGTTRSRVNAFMNKFRDLGFVDYSKDGLHVHRSLLNVVLR